MGGEELVNSRHVQVREKEGKSTLVLINCTAAMAGEYRMVVVSPLGSDLTFSRLVVLPLPKEEVVRLNKMQKTGLEKLVGYEEDKLLEKRRRKLLPSRRRTRDSRKKNQESVLKRFISKVQEG